MPAKGRMEVNELFCKACGLCIEACPQNVIGLDNERITQKGFHPAHLITEGCTGCGICAIICPEAAVTVHRTMQPKPVFRGEAGT